MDIEKVSDIISSLSVPNGLQYKEWVSNSIFTDEEDKGCVEENLYDRLLKLLEPWCDSIYVDLYESMVVDYIKEEQPNTLINLSDKINKTFDSDIVVRMDGNTLAQDDFKLIQQLPKIIQDSGEVGKFNLGNLELIINVMKEYQHTLINVT